MVEMPQPQAVKSFVQTWTGRGYEKGESQPFWLALLNQVFGIAQPETFITFENRVKLDHTSFIDGYIPSTHTMIEQKSLGVDLNKKIKQSDGSELTPYEQARRYAEKLSYSKRPRWIVTCNFSTFQVYDMEEPDGAPVVIELADLEREYYRLEFLVNPDSKRLAKEAEVSIKAGELVSRLYNLLVKQYKDPDSPHAQKSLNILCVRLVFCLYAEDARIFTRNLFHDYLVRYEARDFRKQLLELFEVLNTRDEDRDPYLNPELAKFPYTNGGLFAGNIEIPNFTDEIRTLLLDDMSLGFDWSPISPTIFGAMFESTLNPTTRRQGGMHYTSIENIHKVIDPLFLNDLYAEFEKIKTISDNKKRRIQLAAFQNKIASLKFLDPACGSGNFLTEAYICLRRLENKVIMAQSTDRFIAELYNPIKVSLDQFYGIEINDFAVSVAATALWIAESQMLAETESIIHQEIEFLPLKSYHHIVEANALRIDWNSLLTQADGMLCNEATPCKNVLQNQIICGTNAQMHKCTNAQMHKCTNAHGVTSAPDECPHFDYIMGNPPFVGARLMSDVQKDDVLTVLGKNWKNAGNLDYVACWYKIATSLMKNTSTKAALVSTNSITQGEQVANLWKPLIQSGLIIDFAYQTFIWDNESSQKAHVHCVIVGFSCTKNTKKKKLYLSENCLQEVECINPYLVAGNNVFAESRSRPICDTPKMGIGNKPIDGGNYLFNKDEMDEFIRKEPASAVYFKPWYGSDEFINRRPRYCLWLGDCSPDELRTLPECFKRVQAVKEFRLASKSEGTRKIANKPTRFHVENMPKETYIIIPSVSSERRKYIPMGFMTPDIIASNLVQIIPDATLYHFGVLTSNVHMAWMRAVCGRLKSDYRYSKDIVYNNFPWPDLTPNPLSPDGDIPLSPLHCGEGRGGRLAQASRGREVNCTPKIGHL